MKRTILTTFLGCAALLGVAVPVNAVNLSLSPGTFGGMPADDPAQLGNLKASLVSGDVQDQPDFRFTARLYSAVYAGDPNNPWSGSGGLTFWYRLENILDGATEGRSLQGLGIPLNDSTAAVEVNQDDSPAFAAPADIAGLNGAGISLIFAWFGDTIDVGQQGAWVVVYTDFTDCVEGMAGVVDGTVEDVPALLPVRRIIQTPDHGSAFGLLGLGFAGLLGLRRITS